MWCFSLCNEALTRKQLCGKRRFCFVQTNSRYIHFISFTVKHRAQTFTRLNQFCHRVSILPSAHWWDRGTRELTQKCEPTFFFGPAREGGKCFFPGSGSQCCSRTPSPSSRTSVAGPTHPPWKMQAVCRRPVETLNVGFSELTHQASGLQCTTSAFWMTTRTAQAGQDIYRGLAVCSDVELDCSHVHALDGPSSQR